MIINSIQITLSHSGKKMTHIAADQKFDITQNGGKKMYKYAFFTHVA